MNIGLINGSCGGVCESKHGDPPFFRDTTVMIMPPFRKGIHVDVLRRRKGDEEAFS